MELNNFNDLNSSSLEALLYTPTDQERREIATILLGRIEQRINSLQEVIRSLEGRPLTDFGKYRYESVMENIRACLERKDSLIQML